MARNEFSKPTKREALKRSGGKCEASGPRYGLPEGQRCNGELSKGVIFDHDDPDANSKDNSLDNCRCICLSCNRFKTFKTDIPMIAKTVRQSDKDSGIRKRSTFACSRDSRWKKKMNGSVVPRYERQER